MDALDDALRKMNFDYFGKGLHKVSPAALFDKLQAVFVDLRADEEREALPIEIPRLRNIQIPLHHLPQRWKEIPRNLPVGLFCSGDTRSAIALVYLVARGYDAARIVIGGYEALVEELKPGKLHKYLSTGD